MQGDALRYALYDLAEYGFIHLRSADDVHAIRDACSVPTTAILDRGIWRIEVAGDGAAAPAGLSGATGRSGGGFSG